MGRDLRWKSPLYEDVLQGRGGLAGGKFVFEGDTTTAPAKYLSLPGTAGSYASTPDSAAVSITGDIDIRILCAADAWVPSSAQRFLTKRVAGQFSYDFGINTSGLLTFFSSADGTNQVITALSTVATSLTDGAQKWLNVRVDVDNGAVGNDVRFLMSNDGIAWAQLGTTVTTAGTTSFFDGTASIELGELTQTGRPFAGKIYYADIRNGSDGPIVAKFDPSETTINASSFTSSTGEVWTINGSGQLTR